MAAERIRVPRDLAAYELASIIYAEVTWGREPHYSQVTDAEMAAWEAVAPRWVKGLKKALDAMESVGQIDFLEIVDH